MFDAGLGEKPNPQSEFLRCNCLHHKWLHSSASVTGCGARKSCPALTWTPGSLLRHYSVLSGSHNHVLESLSLVHGAGKWGRQGGLMRLLEAVGVDSGLLCHPRTWSHLPG